ncbi:Coronin [Pseudozyma hubeiensis]|nr:Coronin [Pseudozyma hubeiensis]
MHATSNNRSPFSTDSPVISQSIHTNGPSDASSLRVAGGGGIGDDDDDDDIATSDGGVAVGGVKTDLSREMSESRTGVVCVLRKQPIQDREGEARNAQGKAEGRMRLAATPPRRVLTIESVD